MEYDLGGYHYVSHGLHQYSEHILIWRISNQLYLSRCLLLSDTLVLAAFLNILKPL